MAVNTYGQAEFCVGLETAIRESGLKYAPSVLTFGLYIDHAEDCIVMHVKHQLATRHELGDNYFRNEQLYDRIALILGVEEKPPRYVRIERQRMLSRAKRARAVKPKRI